MLKKTIYLIMALGFFQAVNYSQTVTNNLKNLSEKAEEIIIGKVVQQYSYWDKSKSKILTDVEIDVSKKFKGKLNSNIIVVTHLGGEVGGTGELYTHIPKFSENEEVLLFIEKDKINSGKFKVLSGEEGKISIHEDKSTGEKFTSSNRRIDVISAQIEKFVQN